MLKQNETEIEIDWDRHVIFISLRYVKLFFTWQFIYLNHSQDWQSLFDHPKLKRKKSHFSSCEIISLN